jgi:uncharacterized protein YjbI with pentapeptide repeats
LDRNLLFGQTFPFVSLGFVCSKVTTFSNYIQEGDYPNLVGADMRAVDLSDADLREADFRGANLRGADLRNANLWHADLTEATLIYANIEGAKGLPVDIEDWLTRDH